MLLTYCKKTETFLHGNIMELIAYGFNLNCDVKILEYD